MFNFLNNGNTVTHTFCNKVEAAAYFMQVAQDILSNHADAVPVYVEIKNVEHGSKINIHTESEK